MTLYENLAGRVGSVNLLGLSDAENIIALVQPYTYYSRKAVNNHISNLRKKLRVAPDLPDYVKSVYGIGYKFELK